MWMVVSLGRSTIQGVLEQHFLGEDCESPEKPYPRARLSLTMGDLDDSSQRVVLRQ